MHNKIEMPAIGNRVNTTKDSPRYTTSNKVAWRLNPSCSRARGTPGTRSHRAATWQMRLPSPVTATRTLANTAGDIREGDGPRAPLETPDPHLKGAVLGAGCRAADAKRSGGQS